ncbi:MAG: hypothetical protein KIT17_18700 [Rubrivivax sp.]|nr:hypothetical protein [Rubrivivax sp.]
MLALLADRHPACAAQLKRLASTGHDVASVAGAHAWGEAWSMGIAVNYLDGLHHRAVGSVDDAMALLWSNEALQLHAHARLALLPAAAKHLHMELWTDFVQAQALEHRDTRFATPTAWHRVALDMHDLGATEKGRRRERFDRGLQVGLIHLPVFTNRAELALQHLGPPAAGEEAGGAAAAGSGRAVGPAAADIVGAPIVLELPALAPGQAANFHLLVRLRDPTRRAAPADTVALDAGQHEVFARWRAGRGSVGAARELDAATLDWQASAGGPDEATEGFELGSCALWRALRESHAGPGEEGEAQWLDLALVIRRGGRWSLCPLELGAREVRGELHCVLALEPEDDGGGGAAPAQGLRHALAQPGRARWVATPAGLGALVMVGVDLDAGGVRA